MSAIMSVVGIGAKDYHQKVILESDFKSSNGTNLGRYLQRLHTRALIEDISFLTLRQSSDRCAELDNLFREASRISWIT